MGIARSTYYDRPEKAVDDTAIVEAMFARICAAACGFGIGDRGFPQSLTNQSLGAESVPGPQLQPSRSQQLLNFVVTAAFQQARQAD
jgi:hypothetical protein